MPPQQYGQQNSQQNPFSSLLGGLFNSPKISSPSYFSQQPAAQPTGGMSPLYNAQGQSNASAIKVNKSGGASFTPPVASPVVTTPAASGAAAAPAGGVNTAGWTPDQIKAYNNALALVPKSGFSINTQGAIPSSALSSSLTSSDVVGTRNKYQEYLEGLYQATIPSKPYLDALKQVQDAKQMEMQIQSDFLTNPKYPGDTFGFAQGVQGRQLAQNSLQQNAATNALALQEAIRTGNIDAYKALVAGATPQALSYGQQLTDPINGGVIATGQNQPSYSAQASPFGGYMVFNQRTGQYEIVNPQGTGAGAGGQIPSFLQPAVGTTFTGQQYLDMSLITSAQIPYAQQISASTGMPLLSKEDVNKLQEAQSTYNSGIGLIDNVASLATNLIYAQNPGQALAQAAFLNAQAALPGTQARLYQDARNGFLSLITRAAGEKGTLAEGDVARIQAALPSFSDTVETAHTKLATLQSIFGSALQGNISAYLGSKVSTPTGAPSASGGGIDINQYAF